MKGWQLRFEDPIALPGRELVTLEDAAMYVQTLTAAEQQLPAWQTAVGILIDAAEGRDFLMHARIGMLRAINRDRPEPAPAPRRKKARAYRVIPARNS